MADQTGSAELPTLAAAAAQLAHPLAPEQIELFVRYRDLLLDWNRRINLTAIADPGAVETLHFVDSIAGLAALPPEPGLRVIDVGAGGGLPGLALRIVRPDLRLTLLDSVGKKTGALRGITAALGLSDVEVLTGRAEEVGQDPDRRESWDVALARALAELPVLAELCLPLLRVGGMVLAWKKRDVAAEVEAAGRPVQVLGGRRLPAVPVDLPGLPPDRQIVRLAKERPTPPRYPRRPGVPKQKPLD